MGDASLPAGPRPFEPDFVDRDPGAVLQRRRATRMVDTAFVGMLKNRQVIVVTDPLHKTRRRCRWLAQDELGPSGRILKRRGRKT